MTNRGKPIRVGIVGIGNWARYGHLPALELLPEFQLQAIYSQRPDASRAAAKENDIPHVVGSLDELVRHPEVDLVAVLTTAPQHAEAARAAIAAGKDVYTEWPLTTSTATSAELVRLADEAGVRTMLGVQRRVAPVNRYISDLVRDGYVGKLRSVRLHVSMSYFQARLPKSLSWTAPPENFSSMVAIYAGHFLDMVFTSLGWPQTISALAVNQFPEVTIIETGDVIPTTNADELVLTGTLADGAVLTAHFEGGKRNGSGVQLDITGTEGDLRITNVSAFGGDGEDYVVTGAHGDKLPLAPLTIPDAYDTLPARALPSSVRELAHHYAAFASQSPLAASFRDGVRLHRLIDAIGASSTTHTRITLPFEDRGSK